jgi:MerR family transcriptional regulator, light-induced transcriptional regulator
MSRADPGATTPTALAGRETLGCRRQIAAALVAREFARHPELEERYGEIGRAKSLQDADYHLAYLANALAFDSTRLFVDYVEWARLMLARRGVLPSDLQFHLECLRETLRDHLSPEAVPEAVRFLDAALEAMPEMSDELPSYLEDDSSLSPLAHQYLQALLRGERHIASRLVLDAVEDGASVKDVYLAVFQPAQREVGRLWQINRISVAQEHYCTAATQLIMSQLYPKLFEGERTGPTLVMTSAAGELHEIGARMVADFFEMDGWNTFYTGANTPPDSVIRLLVDQQAAVLGISATITSNVGAVEALVRGVRDHPECGPVKILVGGYPFNRDAELWRKVGADGSGRDAQEAITQALAFMPGAGGNS